MTGAAHLPEINCNDLSTSRASKLLNLSDQPLLPAGNILQDF
jgi:hypothetical protein